MRTPTTKIHALIDLEKLVPLKNGVGSALLKITPALAELLLSYNTDNYRKMIPDKVRSLTALIRAGQFVINPADHICLMIVGDSYVLLNGQNRLTAVKEVGCPVDMFITIVPEEMGRASQDYMDSQSVRTVAQHLAHKGVPKESQAARIVRLIDLHRKYNGEKSRSSSRFDSTTAWEIYRQYQRGVQFVGEVAPKKSPGVTAAYEVALAKAYYCYPEKRLREFHEQFTTRTCENKKTDRSAQLLVNYFFEYHDRHRGGGEFPTHDYYLRVEWAIAAFCEKMTVDTLKSAKKAGDYFTTIPRKQP
jgi:hypothetical protein